MRKLSLLTVAIFLLVADNIFGQTTATLQAEAVIQTQISVANTANVDFGIISGDENAYLSTGVTGESSNSGIISGQSLGSFDLTGSGDVTLTWSNATLAKSDDNTATMPFVPYLSYDLSSTQTEITSGTTEITLSGTPLTVSVGGELQDVAEKASGTYNTSSDGGSALEVTIAYVTV